MAHFTTLLIVLALAGGPVANALCLARCHSLLTKQTCSEEMAEPVISAGSGSCPALVAATPFVGEEPRTTLDSSASLLVHRTAVALTCEGVSHLPRECQAVDGRRVQSVVLRL